MDFCLIRVYAPILLYSDSEMLKCDSEIDSELNVQVTGIFLVPVTCT